MKEKLFNLFLFGMAGLAWWFRKYSNEQSLGTLEQEARMARRGIWSNENPVPPWEFRRAKCSAYAW
jgi:endonuclease YncB( thermonuclease family)